MHEWYKDTKTVGELMEMLSQYDKDRKVILRGASNGTFGCANELREGKHKNTKGYLCLVTY